MIPLGTDWRAPSYADTNATLGWDTGGMGPNNGLPLFGFETTPLEYVYLFNTHFASPLDANGVPIQPYIITYYYRHHFNLPTNNLANLSLVLTNYIDDGVVYWLNGTELARLRIPTNFTGPNLVYTNLALNQGAEGVAEIVTVPFNVLSNLVAGDNTIAAEVHQTSKTSSDDVFGMSLSAVLEESIVITNQPLSQTAVVGKPVTFTVGGTGSFPFYWWYKVAGTNTTLLASGTTNFFYSIGSAQVANQGSYFVTISNRFGKVTSSSAVLTVIPDTFGPLLLSAVVNDTNGRSITVNFDEPVNTMSATNPADYTITLLGTTNQFLVTNAMYGGFFVKLLLDSPLLSTNKYSITVNNVRDRSPNTNIIAPNSWVGVSFSAISNILSLGSAWRFDESEVADLDPSWKSALNYNDDPNLPPFTWVDGSGVFNLTFGTLTFCPGGTAGTGLSLGANTFYFRTKFAISTNFGPNPTLRFHQMVDDGAIFYLNGHEVYRYNMPAGPVSYSTVAFNPIGNAICVSFSTNIASGILVKGNNLLAVEVHQANPDGSDVVFGTDFNISMPITPTLPIEAPAILNIARVDSNTINISWAMGHGFALEAANDPSTGPWIQVPNMATNMLISVTDSITRLGSSPTRFYRLHKVD